MMRDKLLTHRSYVNVSCKKLGLGWASDGKLWRCHISVYGLLQLITDPLIPFSYHIHSRISR